MSINGRNYPYLLLTFIDNIDTEGGKGASEDILPVEWFGQAEARSDGSDDGNERIPDGNLADRIATDELVIEGEAGGGDAYEQQQIEDAQRGDDGERTLHQKARNDEQCTTDGKGIASAHKDVDATTEATRHERGGGSAQGIEDDHAIAPEGELATLLAAEVEREDAGKADDTAEDLAQGHAVTPEKEAGEDDDGEDAKAVEDG